MRCFVLAEFEEFTYEPFKFQPSVQESFDLTVSSELNRQKRFSASLQGRLFYALKNPTQALF